MNITPLSAALGASLGGALGGVAGYAFADRAQPKNKMPIAMISTALGAAIGATLAIVMNPCPPCKECPNPLTGGSVPPLTNTPPNPWPGRGGAPP
jgi:hypothetical protein